MRGTSYEELKQFVLSDPLLIHHCEGFFNPEKASLCRIREGNFVILFWDNNFGCVGHWTALFLNRGVYEYFDSLGESFITKGNFLSTLLKTHSVISSDIRFQCQNTYSCGNFVLYFLYHRILNLLESCHIFLAKYFSLSCQKNELTVNRFMEQMEHGNKS